MQFIVDLERREEAAFPELGLPNLMPVANWVDDSIRWVTRDDRADEILQEAERNSEYSANEICSSRHQGKGGARGMPVPAPRVLVSLLSLLDIAPAISGPCGIREYCHVRCSPIRHEVSHLYSSMATT
jgi:hypothetical protein